MREHHLIVKHSVSRGRDTAGYNIVAIWEGRKKYATLGGGYDMLGTVFGQWLKANYLERLKELKPYDSKYSMEFYQEHGYQPQQDNYGLFQYENELSVDGACGIECMFALAEKCGLRVKRLHDGKRVTTIGFIVYDERGKNEHTT